MIIVSYLESIIGPASKLHVAVLVIKREPSDVNGTRGHKYARGNVGAETLTRDHHIGGVGGVKCLTGAVKSAKYNVSSVTMLLMCNATHTST